MASPTGRGLDSPRAPPKKSAANDALPARSVAAIRREALAARGQGETPKPRSGSEKRQRKHVARIRLDDAEFEKLDERARASGLSMAAYLRARALDTAGLRAKPRPSVDRELLARANADLNRVGNNINQIAHALNSGRDPPLILAEAMDELRGTLTAIRRAAGYGRT